ncbi:Fis family transcriptional regulator [Roseivirga thermotolerans]|uniref:Fis family transcriptional regulator n=2 Tax=Roseivirgaceae TaxID=2762306 RepID=A0ABQ3I8Q3_9BACT|nr:Fis family transcriptional regulator [Roseivirga thermotolerans]
MKERVRTNSLITHFPNPLKSMAKILIIDDEQSIRSTLREILEYEKYSIEEAKDGQEGLEKLIADKFDIALCDVKMPKMDGIELLERVQMAGIDTQFIMISAHGTIETAVDATKMGAFDFVPKPPDLNRLLLTVKNALDKSSLVTETKTLKRKLSKKYEMVGESKALAEVKEMMDKVGPTDARVLITGPNGSGKELVARGIHERSNRASTPFVEVNCAAIPAELIESELFGHEKGAFTSAHKQRIGKFEQANEGTLFLDEIGDMSLSAQAKVLRALQEHKITRVGGDKDINVNVRVLAATNKDLRKEIAENRFREDLYHRLSVIVIQVPPLKDRKEDIPMLVDKFLDDIADEYGTKKKKVSADGLKALQAYDWSGNIRELRNVTERLVIMCGDEIGEEDVKKYLI